MSFLASDTRATAADAAVFVEQVERWTGGDHRACGFLVDCARISDADAGWRAVLNDYFRKGRVPVTVGWYNTSTLIRVMVEMFVLATPQLDGKVLEDEVAARAYLREKGFG